MIYRARVLLLAIFTMLTVWAQAQTGPVTNVFTDQDIRTVLSEVATLGGVTILPDTSVKAGEVSIEFKGDTVESALDKLSIIGGLMWKKKGDMYLVSTGAPDSPMFNEFAKTKVYIPRTQPAESLYALLARSYIAYAQLDKSANMISITAPEKQLNAIWESLEAADGIRKQFVVEALVTEVSEVQGKDRLLLELAQVCPRRRPRNVLCQSDHRRHREPEGHDFEQQGNSSSQPVHLGGRRSRSQLDDRFGNVLQHRYRQRE